MKTLRKMAWSISIPGHPLLEKRNQLLSFHLKEPDTELGQGFQSSTTCLS